MFMVIKAPFVILSDRGISTCIKKWQKVYVSSVPSYSYFDGLVQDCSNSSH